jgi:hypothetical protein
MMSLSDLPVSFWGYALDPVKIPYEEWFGKKPKLSYLKVWGCDAYVKKFQPDKLESKVEKYVFVGYPKETVRYIFYDISKGKTLVAKTRFFLEKEFVEKGDINKKIDLDEIIEPSLHEPSGTMKVVSEASSNVEEENNVDYNDDGLGDSNGNVRRSKRVHNQPKWFGDSILTVMLMEH